MGATKNFYSRLSSPHREQLIISNQVQKCHRQWNVTFKMTFECLILL